MTKKYRLPALTLFTQTITETALRSNGDVVSPSLKTVQYRN
nr:hypothetical protein [Niallia taxi]